MRSEDANEEHRLAKFAEKQQSRKREGKLSLEYEKALDAIGFDWGKS